LGCSELARPTTLVPAAISKKVVFPDPGGPIKLEKANRVIIFYKVVTTLTV
jgi:hypothetical protein